MSGNIVVTGQINNNSTFTLTLSSSSLQWGDWDTNPPNSIAPNSTGSFIAQGADGSATGTQGQVNYTIDGYVGMISLYFEDPFIGGNSGSGSSTISVVTASGSIDGGDATTATYNIASA
jgi:hypothetical protein